MRWSGKGRLSPPTTGPTGTNGGANVGMGPFPSTSITCCDGSHIRNASESTVAMASWSAWYCFSGSFTPSRSEEHTSELQSHSDIVCRLLLEKKYKAPLFSDQFNAYLNSVST